jgi:hypothetical protein
VKDRFLFLILISLASFGCGRKDSGSLSFELERATLPFGEAPSVRYSTPVPQVEGQQYWITVVEAGSPDSEWGPYSYLIPGDTQQVLPQPAHGGDWEVRLHDLYPQNSFKVIQRATLRVEGGPAVADSVVQSMEAVAQGEPEAAPTGQAPVPVAFTVQANATTTKYGPVIVDTRTMLHMRHAARDGGAYYELDAAPGAKFLVVQFPETERLAEEILYEDAAVRLYLEGSVELTTHSAAPGGVNNEINRKNGEPMRFETEIWAATINDANFYPFAIAFEVPSEARSAWLKVEDKILELSF